ncbi:hypothetical protein OEA41_009789 [Lepraria neglecta]|uniref:Uncharacterized protein n=1 Tax=Lepraria neglecta TaxID=209136 RepID=A0AAD9YV59_9LECA|nr:hypothetical protein OEA41_009789 [Lepraria neglecta]
MERLYGLYKCHICHRPSDSGWVYSCTQDDKLPVNDAVIPTTEASSLLHDQVHSHFPSTGSTKETFGPKQKLFQMPTAQLSPWIEKAIKEGHYTPEQAKILRAQKQKVSETACAAVERFEKSQSRCFNSPSKISNASQSVDANPHLPYPVINEVQEPSTIDASILFAEPKLQMFPYCKYRACQLCRPTYRDRTWQCFDEIFANDSPINPDEIEAEERPLASLAVMRTIGLREPPPRRRPQLRALNSRAIYTINEAGQVVFKNNSYRKTPDLPCSADVTDVKIESDSKLFRESWKRAIKGMLTSPRNSIGSNLKKMGRSSAESTSAEVNTSELTEMWNYLYDDLLREASNVPLPAEDSIEELTEDIKEVDIGGVAITEEAAETGTADIILSV